MDKKRVELSVHTNMGNTGSVNDTGNYINAAMRDWQPAIAITDTECVQAFPEAFKCVDTCGGIKLIYGCELYYGYAPHYDKRNPFYILAKNKTGLKELYKLISNSPKIFSLDEVDRKNLILGISIQGELIQKIIEGADDKELGKIIERFDYVLLNPIEYFGWYTKIKDESQAKEITKRIIDVCEKNNVLPIASDEAYFVFSDDGECRRILLDYMGVENCDEQPNLYFRKTDEMLAEFEYLGKEKAYEIVVTNSNLVADMIDDTFAPFDTDTKYPNEIAKLKEITYAAAYKKYDNPLPSFIRTRIQSELHVIGGNARNATKFILAEKITEAAKEKGYSIVSRGSVGSSLVANLLGITNTNPLDTHYFCKNCKYIEFHTEEDCGVDLPNKICPKCGKELIKDGYTLPEETYTNYDFGKELDISLNLPPEFICTAHEILRKNANGKIIDYGQIQTMPPEFAYNLVIEYARKRKLKFHDLREIDYFEKLEKCKSDIQSALGVFILPPEKEITDYTPVEYLSDVNAHKQKITHFDYREIYHSFLKIDLLYPHNSLSMLFKLENATGIKANQIPLDDKKTIELIKACDTDGIPELENDDVREVIKTVNPHKFNDLIKLFGLCYGKGTWNDNRKYLFNKEIRFSDFIAYRDDVMLTLIKYGLDRQKAFLISEQIRKGKGFTNEQYDELLDLGVPNWYLDLCNKIEYLFPKAHCAEYVRLSFILAYYKTHFRTEFEKIAEEYKVEESEDE